MSPLLSYQDVVTEIGLGRRGRTHLLLGNGFSISCDRRFCYKKLYDVASAEYSENLNEIFSLEGNNNFEGVLKIFDDTMSVCTIYGETTFADSLSIDKNVVKESLISALVETHMTDATELSDDRKIACGNFLRPYFNVFTTNYDLLLYWVEMANQGLQKNDGFRNDDLVDNAAYVVYKEPAGGKSSIFFLHGALHIYRSSGQLRKHTWCRTQTTLIQGIRDGFGQNQYPLFVAEGDSNKKLQQIMKDPYLDYCLGKLGRIEGNLVVYGMAFGDSDNHIVERLKKNLKLQNIYVGLFDGEATEDNIRTITKIRAIEAARRNTQHPIHVHFFESETAQIWA